MSRNKYDESNPDYERLIRICQKNEIARQKALLDEILSTGRKPIELDDGTMVIESSERHPISLVAHFDKVHGSYGYNDNGMALVAILGMLDRLPANVEVVFTNGEESGCIGAETYLNARTEKPIHCVNLDVCGFGDRIYLDRMNSTHLDGIKDVVNGCCPMNDAWRFRDHDIESTCVSTSYGDDFSKGIRKIFDTMHNARYDNRVDILDFDILPKVRDKVMEIIDTINTDNLKNLFQWNRLGEKMKKYVRIYKKEHEFEIEVLDEMPEFKTAMPVGIMVGEGTEILLNLDNENDLSELLHAFACTVAKENVKLGKNVAKGIIKSAKDGIKKLANKGKETEK